MAMITLPLSDEEARLVLQFLKICVPKEEGFKEDDLEIIAEVTARLQGTIACDQITKSKV